VKNRTRLVLLNVINDVRDRCFRAVSTVISKVLGSFRRKSGVLLKKRHIKHKSYLSLIDGYKSIVIIVNGCNLCKIERPLMQQEVRFRIFKREEYTISNGPHSLLI
jgi:hypothetical protein